jgi:hypothetical protein
MKRLPWAKFNTPKTPKTRVNPAAKSQRYIEKLKPMSP